MLSLARRVKSKIGFRISVRSSNVPSAYLISVSKYQLPGAILVESKETLVMEIEAQAHYNLTDGKSLVNTKQTDSMNDDITEKVKRPE